MYNDSNGYKGSTRNLNRQRKDFGELDESQIDRANEQAKGAVGLFITVAILLGLVVMIMKTGEVAAPPIKQSAVVLTDTFDSLTALWKSAVPTILVVCLLYGFLQVRKHA